MSSIQDNITTTIIELFSIFYEKIAQKQSNPQPYFQNLAAFKQILYDNVTNKEIIINYLNQSKSHIAPINPEDGLKFTITSTSPENQNHFNSALAINEYNHSPMNLQYAAQDFPQITSITTDLIREMNTKIQFLKENIYSESLNNILFFADDTKIFRLNSLSKEISRLTITSNNDTSTLIKEIRTVEQLLNLPEIAHHPELKKIKLKFDEQKEAIQVIDNNNGFYYGCALSWIISLINSTSSSKSLSILINIFCLVYSRKINLLSNEFSTQTQTARDYFCEIFQNIIKNIQRHEIDVATKFYNDSLNSPFFEKCLNSFFKEVLFHNVQNSSDDYKTYRSKKLYENEIDLNDLENIATLVQMDISMLTISPHTLSEKYIICKDLGLNDKTNKVPQVLHIISFEKMNFGVIPSYMFLFKEQKIIKQISNMDDILGTNIIEDCFEISNVSSILNIVENVKLTNPDVLFDIYKDKKAYTNPFNLNTNLICNLSIQNDIQNKNIIKSKRHYGQIKIDTNDQSSSEAVSSPMNLKTIAFKTTDEVVSSPMNLKTNTFKTTDEVASSPMNRRISIFKTINEAVSSPMNRRSNTNIPILEFKAHNFDQIPYKKPYDDNILPKAKQMTLLKHAQLRNNSSAIKKAGSPRHSNFEEVLNNFESNDNTNEEDSSTLSKNDSGSIEVIKINHHSSNKSSNNHANKTKKGKSNSKLNSKRNSFDDHLVLKSRFSNEESNNLNKIPHFLKKRLNEINNTLNINATEVQEVFKKYLDRETMTPTSTTEKSNSLMTIYIKIVKANRQKIPVLEYNDGQVIQQISSTSSPNKYTMPSLPENYIPYMSGASNTEYIAKFNSYERQSIKSYERQSIRNDNQFATISFPLPLPIGISPRPDVGSENISHNGSARNAVDKTNKSHNNRNTLEFIGRGDSLGLNSWNYPQLALAQKSTLNKDNFDLDHFNNQVNSFNIVDTSDIKNEEYDKILNNFMVCIRCGREFLKAEKYDIHSNICYLCR